MARLAELFLSLSAMSRTGLNLDLAAGGDSTSLAASRAEARHRYHSTSVESVKDLKSLFRSLTCTL